MNMVLTTSGQVNMSVVNVGVKSVVALLAYSWSIGVKGGIGS